MYLTYNGKYLLVNGKYVNYGSPMDPLTDAYINRMTTAPTPAHKSAINSFILTTKTIIVDKADVMYLGNINDSNDSFINIVKNSHHGTIQGTGLVWDPYWGYRNPDGSGYVDTNYNPNTQGFNYSLNNAGIGIYITDNTGGSQHALYSYEDTTKRAGFLLNYHAVNDGANGGVSIPFLAGLQVARRTGSTARAYINQNIVTSTNSQASTSVPNANFYLFRHIAAGSANNYLGGLNFVYIGAPLTDSEYTLLNNAYNDYLIECLFIKYGQNNWGVQMAQSYFLNLHNFEKYEAYEVYDFIKRMQPDYTENASTGYYYNTFGPSGQNKTSADFIMHLKTGGSLIFNAWAKTGDTLRWNFDGSIVSNNSMPAYTRGTNLGVVTLSTTDGWNRVTSFILNQTANSVNSFYGNFPLLGKLKTGGNKYTCYFYGNKLKIDMRNFYDSWGRLYAYNIYEPGYLIADFNNITMSTMDYITCYTLSDQSELYANCDLFVTPPTTQLRFQGSATGKKMMNAVGTLKNLASISNTLVTITIQYCNLSGGTNIWNRYIGTFNLSNNSFSTEEVDSQLSVINTYFSSVTPIKNVTIDLSGTSMGIPTDGSNNSDLLGIVAKHTAAGYTATISVRTS